MDEHWDELVKHFCAVSDRLGMPIDDEIFDTVIAFNALDITTNMSCSGHITRDEGDIRYPWVDFSASNPTIKDLKKQHVQLHKKALKLQDKLTQISKKKTNSKQLPALTKKSNTAWLAYHSLGHKLRKLQVPMRQQVINYLIQFYGQRVVPFDRRLTLSVFSSRTRIESQGAADFHLCEPRDVQLQKLAEYREEMRAFTDFLKTIYMTQRSEEGTASPAVVPGARES